MSYKRNTVDEDADTGDNDDSQVFKRQHFNNDDGFRGGGSGRPRYRFRDNRGDRGRGGFRSRGRGDNFRGRGGFNRFNNNDDNNDRPQGFRGGFNRFNNNDDNNNNNDRSQAFRSGGFNRFNNNNDDNNDRSQGFRRGGFNRFNNNDDNDDRQGFRGRGGFRGNFRRGDRGRGRGGQYFFDDRGRGRGRFGDRRQRPYQSRGGFRPYSNRGPELIKLDQDAPSFDNIRNEDSQNVSLQQFQGQYVVLFIYYKDATHTANVLQTSFNEVKEDFDKLDAVILGVSRDDVGSHKAAIDAQGLKYSLLADEDSKISKSYGALDEFDRITGRTIIIDPEGKVAALWQNQYDFSTHAQDVLQRLQELKNGKNEIEDFNNNKKKGDENDIEND